MGSTRQENREDYTWWDYENLATESGADWDSFNYWSNLDSSLQTALEEAQNMRSNYFHKVKRRYLLTNSEVPLLLKTYLGYHPAYGAYVMNIGPYFSEGNINPPRPNATPEEIAEYERRRDSMSNSQNRFSYFYKRIRKSTREEIKRSLEENMRKYMDAYGVELEDGDFQFVLLRHPEYDPSRKRQPRKQIAEVVTSLDPESTEGADFYEREPMVNPESSISLNSRGYEKLLRAIWGNQYTRIINEMSASQNRPVEEVLRDAVSDIDVLEGIYEQLKIRYEEAVVRGEAVGLEPPPRFLDLSLNQRGSGQQRTSGIEKTSKLFLRNLGFQREVLEVMAEGITDPTEIQSRLNADPSRRGKEVSLEEVRDKLQDIRDMDPDGQKTPEELIAEVDDGISGFGQSVGFGSLGTAVNMAKLMFTHMPIDPKTGSKKGMRYLEEAQTIPLDMEHNFIDVSEDQLVELRSGADERREDLAEATDEEIERELGRRLRLPNVQDYERTEVQPTEETPTPKPSLTEEEEEESDITLPALEDLIGNTFSNLIKIAEELDSDGKSEAAEEVHRVLRKYEGEIKRR